MMDVTEVVHIPKTNLKVWVVENEHAAWDKFVNQMTNSTLYHQFSWKRVIQDSFGHKCYYLAVANANQEWLGVLPLVHMRSILFGNFLVSLPFFNYGGLLSQNQDAVISLLSASRKLQEKLGAQYIELRQLQPLPTPLPTKIDKVTMQLELEPDIERQWKNFRAKVRNQIRKAENNQLNIKIGHTDLLNQFYMVFCRNMRDLGTPVYSHSFFKNVLTTFPNKSKIFIINYQDYPVAAGLTLSHRRTLEIPWASSIRRYNSLCPNNLLYWELIKYSIENGFTVFDFGRSSPNEGTYNFKKQWGAKPIQLNWQYLLEQHQQMPRLSPKNSKYSLAIKLWKKMPLGLTRILGPSIVKNIP